MVSMAETWELGLEKVSIENLENWVVMMGLAVGKKQKKGDTGFNFQMIFISIKFKFNQNYNNYIRIQIKSK